MSHFPKWLTCNECIFTLLLLNVIIALYLHSTRRKTNYIRYLKYYNVGTHAYVYIGRLSPFEQCFPFTWNIIKRALETWAHVTMHVI